jgi:hypothetical protein
MIDEFYNIGRVQSPNRVYITAETRHGRGIGLRSDVTANILGKYGFDIETIFGQVQTGEDTIDYDII